MAEDSKVFSQLIAEVTGNEVTLRDKHLPWKYWITLTDPRKVADELRKIADWLYSI